MTKSTTQVNTVFLSTKFHDVPTHYQGSRQSEEPLDLMYILPVASQVGEVRLVDVYNLTDADIQFVRRADVLVASTTNSYLQWNNHPLGLDLFGEAWRRIHALREPAFRWSAVLGPHVLSHLAEIQQLGATRVLSGEAELELGRWILRLASNDTGSETVSNARPYIVSDLDQLPAPGYEWTRPFDFNAHNHPGSVRAGHLYEASRGCPYMCSFCNTVTHRREHRTKTVAKVRDDLLHLMSVSPRRYVYFIDESFGFRDDWTLDLCESVAPLGLNFGAQGNLRFMTPQKLEAMGRCGFISMEFGLESGDDRIVRAVGKNNRLDAVPTILTQAIEAGIAPLLFVLVGLPGETAQTLRSTLDLLSRVPAGTRVSVAMPTPYRDTRLWRWGVEDGLIPAGAHGRDLYRYSGMVRNTLNIDAGDARRFVERFGPNSWVSPRYLSELEQHLFEMVGAR